MKFNIKTQDIYKYAFLTIALICVFWSISVYEFFMSADSGIIISNPVSSIAFKFLNDFWAGLIIGIAFFPVYVFCYLILRQRALMLTKVLFALFVIIQFALVKYSLTTLLNLGADILGYSLDDIYLTVTASESFSITYFLPFVLFSALFFLFFKLIKTILNGQILIGIGVVSFLVFGSLKLIFQQSSEITNRNKIAYLTWDIIKFQSEKNKLYANNLFDREDYPLLKPYNKLQRDVLSPFFNLNEEKPNIVVLMVEGLGAEFIDGNMYSGFTPFLDSLASKSLFWENFVSNSGRTFGVLPSLLASLPFGETGFLELPKTPSHISLISILKANGYTTSYYSGDQSSFDKKINFLEYNDIDFVVDENKFGPDYEKTQAGSEGFSWGYPDAEIFRKTLSTLNNIKQPRLDIIMTLSNHEPFNFPNKELYEAKVDSLLNSNKTFKVSKGDVLANKNIYASLSYTDNSIKDFMDTYSKRDDYNNTIFIITGDHRLIPINQKDKLCRFHVPLYVFSPMLKRPERFKSISSHWDVTPSLLSFLMKNYKFKPLQETSWMSEGLDTARYFRNIHKISMMRYKGNVNDFIYKDYLFSDGELYKINDDFGTYKVQEEQLIKTMADSLMNFKRMNAYVTQKNRIFPDSLNVYAKPRKEFSKEQLVTIKDLTKGLDFDQAFEVAKEKAFKKDYSTSRLICDYILNEFPNHSDARTLKGRTYAWEKNYKKAEVELLNVIKRTPYYEDGYLALLDLFWWSNQEDKSQQILEEAIMNGIKNPNVSFKMAKAYQRMEKKLLAAKLVDSMIQIYPDNSEFINFKKTLN